MASPSRPKSPARIVLAFGIPFVFLASSAVLLAYYWFEVRPWYEWPKEPVERIDERWQLVVDLAKTPEECGAGGQVVTYENPVDVLNEAREKIKKATVQDPNPLVEVLILARPMQICGNYISSMTGNSLSMEVCEHARDNNIPIAGALEANRLHPEDILPALARERISAYNSIEEVFLGSGPPNEARKDSFFLAFDGERERAVYKQFYANLIQAALPHRDNPATLERTIEKVAADYKHNSIILNLGLHSHSLMAKTMGTHITEYNKCCTAVLR